MQDKAIVEIGKLQLQELGDKQPYEFFIQNMFPDKDNYKMILAVFMLKSIDGKFSCNLDRIDADNVSRNTFTKYAYRKGSSRGGDVTFTTKFGDIEKKLKTLVDNQFKSLISHLRTSKFADEFRILNAVYEFLIRKDSYELVKNELSQLYNGLSKDDKMSSGLSILCIVDGKEYYLEDFKIVQQILYASGTVDKSEKYNIKSEGTQAICSICMVKKDKLHGFASPFKYATVDKPGMVSGFFNQANNWKNYPICTDCSLAFELGKSYVTDNLSSYFYGKAYYMIPKTLLSKDSKSLKIALKRLHKLYDELSEKGQQIKRNEEKLGEMIAKEDDYFNLNLLFFEENPTTKAIKIKLLLEEIVPSRFRKLFVDVPIKINNHPLYENVLVINKEPKNLHFSFGLLKTFFEADFYDLIQRVFLLQSLSKEVLYKKFMMAIRENYNTIQTKSGKYEIPRILILKAHLTLSYFQELKLISYNSNFKLMDTTISEKKKSGFNEEKFKQFVIENKGFLDYDYKVGIFLVGILVKFLLDIQNQSLQNTPFEKKLKGYNLNAELLQSIYKEALAKIPLYENQSHYSYGDLRNQINSYFTLNIDKVKKISNNELSFYFVAGIEFGSQFKFKKEKE